MLTIHEKLALLHKYENDLNKQLNDCDKAIMERIKQKQKLAAKISKNMRHRNKLIEKL